MTDEAFKEERIEEGNGRKQEGLYLKGRSMNECKGKQQQGIRKISGKKM